MYEIFINNVFVLILKQGIKDLVLCLDFEGYKKEIKTVDAQDSCNEGVLVLVTGCLTGKDNLERSFTQTFFLAPHAKGYYVLNDVFRFVDVPKAVTPPVNDANEDVSSTSLLSNEGGFLHIFAYF